MSYDCWAVRTIISTLCAIALIGSLTLFYLAFRQFDIDPLVASLVTFVIGLLSPSPLSKAKNDEPQEVVTPPGEALDVTQV